MTKVVTRIAPSPTGMMHIGTARTALFNYLYARRHGGQFKVRIEDTDKDRNDMSMVMPIINGLSWLGLLYDGDAVFQSRNVDRHVEIANALLASGHAYRCYLTNDEANALKTQGTAFRSPHRDLTDAPDAPYSIRLKVPLGVDIVVKDLVRGDVLFKSDNIDDLVIMRSNGAPTYNLAVVVDDHDMGITHVIRGDDHLNNAAKQQLMFEAMGWDVPVWAHIPLIHDDKGKKLSKRTGTAVSIADFQNLGYTPDGMFNYLTRLGWGGDGTDEIFSKDYAIARFDVADVVSSPARLDMNKLDSVSNAHIRATDDQRLTLRLAVPLARLAPEVDMTADEATLDLILRAVSKLKEGAKTIEGLAKSVLPFVTPVVLSDKAKGILDGPDNMLTLARLVDRITVTSDATNTDKMTADDWNTIIRDWSEAVAIPMKDVGPAVRSALTGNTTAPDLGTLIYILGPKTAIARMSAALKVT